MNLCSMRSIAAVGNSIHIQVIGRDGLDIHWRSTDPSPLFFRV